MLFEASDDDSKPRRTGLPEPSSTDRQEPHDPPSPSTHSDAKRFHPSRGSEALAPVGTGRVLQGRFLALSSSRRP